jgi:hypothetical protein
MMTGRLIRYFAYLPLRPLGLNPGRALSNARPRPDRRDRAREELREHIMSSVATADQTRVTNI